MTECAAISATNPSSQRCVLSTNPRLHRSVVDASSAAEVWMHTACGRRTAQYFSLTMRRQQQQTAALNRAIRPCHGTVQRLWPACTYKTVSVETWMDHFVCPAGLWAGLRRQTRMRRSWRAWLRAQLRFSGFKRCSVRAGRGALLHSCERVFSVETLQCAAGAWSRLQHMHFDCDTSRSMSASCHARTSQHAVPPVLAVLLHALLTR